MKYVILGKGPGTAEIRIDGPIGESFFDESITAKAFIRDLEKIKAQSMTVYINSPGGSVMDATAIMSALKRHPAKVNCVIDGWALSAASLIAMSADTVSIGANGMMMLHNPRTYAGGDAPSLRKTADILDKIKSGMVESYNTRLQLSADEVAAILDAETWYTASEAVSAGLADAIDPTAAALPATVPAAIKSQFSFIPNAYAHYCEEPVMSHESKPDTSADSSGPVTQPVAAPEAVAASQSEPAPAPAESEPDISSIVAQAVSGSLKAERERIKTIRAAFAPWLKKGYGLHAVQTQCEEDGCAIEAVNARLLAALGGMAEPLASPTQGAPDADPLADAISAYRAAHPTATVAQASAAVLRDNPKLYDAYIASRKGI